MKVKREQNGTVTITATARFLVELMQSEQGAADDYNPIEERGAIEAVELTTAVDEVTRRNPNEVGDATINISQAVVDYLTCDIGLLFHVRKWLDWAEYDFVDMSYVRSGRALQRHLERLNS